MAESTRKGPHPVRRIAIFHKLGEFGTRLLVGAPDDGHQPRHDVAVFRTTAEVAHLLLHVDSGFAAFVLVELDSEYDFGIARSELLPAGGSTSLNDNRMPLRRPCQI